MPRNSLMISICILMSYTFSLAQTPSASLIKPTLADGQIAKVLISINNGEADAARWAREHGENKEVKKFAKDMIFGHKDNSKKTEKILRTANLKPEDSELSKNISDESSMSNLTLKSRKGKDLDKAYIAQQISMHQNALSHINNTLIPSVSNASLKSHLEKTRRDVSKHLEHAQSIESKLE